MDFATFQARSSPAYYKRSELRAAVVSAKQHSIFRRLEPCKTGLQHAARRLGRRHGRDGRHGCGASEDAKANGRTTVVRWRQRRATPLRLAGVEPHANEPPCKRKLRHAKVRSKCFFSAAATSDSPTQHCV